MAKKDLQYYLNLNYDTVVRRIEDEGETIFKAFTRELDSDVFYGLGDSPEEAMESLENVKEELFPYYLEQDLPIAEPAEQDEALPSGRFVVRMSPRTHKMLIEEARRNAQSLNAYVNSVLEKYALGNRLIADLEAKLTESLTACFKNTASVWSMASQWETLSTVQRKRTIEDYHGQEAKAA